MRIPHDISDDEKFQIGLPDSVHTRLEEKISITLIGEIPGYYQELGLNFLVLLQRVVDLLYPVFRNNQHL